jgi:beta-galactosidase
MNMKKYVLTLYFVCLAPIVLGDFPVRVRLCQSFDSGWKFFKGDAITAHETIFNDNQWKMVNVPHDWSIEGPFLRDAPSGGDGAFLPTGISWYRKTFTLPTDWYGKRVLIEFDGVMANSQVWINGHLLGSRPSGYVSFQYELTPHLKAVGESNVLAVKTDTTLQPASRWYAGAGIYRHVRLIVTGPVRLAPWSTFVSASKITDQQAAIRVQAGVVNTSDQKKDVSVEITIVDPQGKSSATAVCPAQTVEAGKTAEFQRDLVVMTPIRWDIDNPVLYTAQARVVSGGLPLDDESVSFGIRECSFEPATGFRLNGRNLKIKGVCVHHDGGAFGAAVPLQVWRDRLTTLKELGANAIRTAHNAVAPEFLDLCDRMGMLVMNEFLDVWTVGKRKGDFHLYFNDWAMIDTRDTIRRDRNHPCVIVYSAGNEIHDTPKADFAKRILNSLIEIYHREDPTRPVTQGLFRPNQSRDYDNGLADMLDVVGQNYREGEILAAYRQNSKRKILGTENGHDLSVWLALRDHPEYAGQFIWSGIDYLGESRAWPAISTPFGIIDRTSGLRPRSYQRQSWWSDRPMVRIVRRIGKNEPSPIDPGYELRTDDRFKVTQFADWTPLNLQPHSETVECYSNCESVEVFLNGRSLGPLPKPANDSARVWKVEFEPGTIKAVASNAGKTVATDEHHTATKASKILLYVERKEITQS